MRFATGMATALLLVASVSISPQAPPIQTAGTDTDTSAPHAIDTLARDVDRVESLREVKDLQRTYTHLSQFGQWAAMAALFAEDGILQWGDKNATGRQEIATWLRNDAGAMNGRTPGSLHTEIIEQPLANLSVDGRTAKVRWDGMRFLGDGQGRTRIEGGIYENEYVLEHGHWKIATMHYYPHYEGDYDTGWTNIGGDGIPITPPHFTLDQTGVPIPEPSGPAPRTDDDPEELADRIGRLNDEDAVRNLQDSYGYYVDRKMWSDVVDLFTHDAIVRTDDEVDTGPDGARRAMERMGTENLSHGQLNEHPIFDLVVNVSPSGREATTRGIQIGMLGEADKDEGSWEFSVFRNRFAKQGGVWKMKEVNVAPLLRADYDEGWGNGGTTARTDPGKAPELLDEVAAEGIPTPQAGPAAGIPDAPEENLTDLDRRLDRSKAFEGAENVSSAYGYYLDDHQWRRMAGLFAVKGNKQSPFAGYYFGYERILGAATATYGPSDPPDALRERISFHWRTQPVIKVSHDGRSVTIRTRLFQPRTSQTVTPGFTGFNSGMYPNDQAVLENGIWRLWTVTIDEPYFNSPNWEDGWAGAEDPPEDAPNPPGSPLLEKYPPDILLTELGEREEGFRGGTGKTVAWPSILPMWFHYRNPVSGRVPDHYWPDCVTCERFPESSMTAHGYQMPPTGPSIDGVDVP